MPGLGTLIRAVKWLNKPPTKQQQKGGCSTREYELGAADAHSTSSAFPDRVQSGSLARPKQGWTADSYPSTVPDKVRE